MKSRGYKGYAVVWKQMWKQTNQEYLSYTSRFDKQFIFLLYEPSHPLGLATENRDPRCIHK